MAAERLVFRTHAIERMFRRRIMLEEVRHVLATGEVIEDYPDDLPYPSQLMLGWSGQRPIHVVAAADEEAGEIIIIDEMYGLQAWRDPAGLCDRNAHTRLDDTRLQKRAGTCV